MNKLIIVINSGSSSIKFAVYRLDAGSQLAIDINGEIDGIGNRPRLLIRHSPDDILADVLLSDPDGKNHQSCLNVLIQWLSAYLKNCKIMAVGHRIVHGGEFYTAPVIVTDKILVELEKLIPLAPLHQPHNLAPIQAFTEIFPDVPQIACFDTAFHSRQPDVAQRYALPRRYFDEGVRRYGFHGLSFQSICSTLYDLEPRLIDAKIIVAHLGNGSSLCAIQNGKSIATTMGFSTLDGLVMGTRCGQIDPGVLLYLIQHDKLDIKAIEHLLYFESGLLGVSGIASDMRELLANADIRAQSAIDLYVYRVVREIGSLSAALGGLDALVFSGGIGENSDEIRARVCKQIEWLGLLLDDSKNQVNAKLISTADSKVPVWVLPSDENGVIAKSTLQLIISSSNTLF